VFRVIALATLYAGDARPGPAHVGSAIAVMKLKRRGRA
jgi:hypothetical protein